MSAHSILLVDQRHYRSGLVFIASMVFCLSISMQTASAFWTVDCSIIAQERSDPIVSPGQVSEHQHVVAGSSRFGPSATNDILRSAACTSCDVEQDKSAYWMPQLYVVPPDLVGANQDDIIQGGGVPVPNLAGTSFIIYYKLLTKTGEKHNNDPNLWELIVPFPEDFRLFVPEQMILNKTMTASSVFDRPLTYKCLGFRQQEDTPNFPSKPARCTYGMRTQLTFPSCWDGVRSDTPDHFSHMAYPSGSWAGSSCPDSHPVRLPTLFIEVIYDTKSVAKYFQKGWKLTFPQMPHQYTESGEPLFHADFMNGWDQAFLEQALGECGVTPCGLIRKQPSDCQKEDLPPPTPSPTPSLSTPEPTDPPSTSSPPPPSPTPAPSFPSLANQSVQLLYQSQNGLQIKYHLLDIQDAEKRELLGQLLERTEWTTVPASANELPEKLAVFCGIQSSDNQSSVVGNWIDGPQVPLAWAVTNVAVVTQTSDAPETTATPVNDGCGDGWTTLFEDTFDSLDDSKWSFQMYDGWQYNIGGWGNDEKQWYTNRTENVDARDGNLVVTARKEANTSFVWQNCWDECRDRCIGLGNSGQDLQYCIDACGWPRCDEVRVRAITSARLRTYKLFSVGPSSEHETIRIEAQINLPKSPGLFPAFWMLPEDGATDQCSGCGSYGNWPLSGEIDVMESYNDMSVALGTIHYGDPWPFNKYRTSVIDMPTDASSAESTGFQTYALEWDATSMKWFMNGEEYGRVTSDQWYTSGVDAITGSTPGPNAPFDRKFHLLMNMAVGGNLPENKYRETTGQNLELSDIQSGLGEDGKQMLVDYVRVCGKTASSS